MIPAAATDIATEALEQANLELLFTVINLNRHCFKIAEDIPISHFSERYDELKTKELDILMLFQRLQQHRLDVALTQRSSNVVQSCREALISAKELKDIREDLIRLRHHQKPEIQTLYQTVRTYQSQLYQQLHSIISQPSSEKEKEREKEKLRNIADANKQQHEAIHQAILPLVNNEELQRLCPSLLNVNREIYLSNAALQQACQAAARAV